MNLPFNKEQFLDVFKHYNNTVFPAQIILYLLALLVILLTIKKIKYSDSIISGILSLFWFWMGVVYNLIFFATINKLAYAFGTFFVFQGFILLYHGVYKSNLNFSRPNGLVKLIWGLMLLYALILYPLLGFSFGHEYPKSPTFGLPCPTTIFTLGMLMISGKKYFVTVFLIPLIWSVIGFFAAVKLGIYEDIGLLAAGVISALALILESKQRKKIILS